MKQFYTVKDVMRILQVKEAKAYKIIRKLNEELEQRGYIVVSGKVSKKIRKVLSQGLKIRSLRKTSSP